MTRFAPIALATVATTAITLAPLSVAVALMLPPGLNPGDQYRLAFVTSDDFLTTAESTDIAVYNQVANAAASSQADLAALNTDWFALVSTPGTPPISAKENSGTDDSPAADTGVPIFRVDGVAIADHYDDLWDRTIAAPLNVTEAGSVQDATTAWTGTLAEGTFNPNQPLGSDAFFSGRGQIGATGDLWIATFGSTNQSTPMPIYVISGVLTAADSPLRLGDFNGDGLVDAADYTVWRDNQGASDAVLAPGSTSDATDVVDANEYGLWTDNFGRSYSDIDDGTSIAVPEPGSLALASLCTLLATRPRGARRYPPGLARRSNMKRCRDRV